MKKQITITREVTGGERQEAQMFRLLQWLTWMLGQFILGLRYRRRIIGLEEVFRNPGPYLILPNHPAYSDPPNVIVALWPHFFMRPMLLESNFRSPLLAPFAWLLQAIKVPDIAEASAEARQRAEAAVASVIQVLKSGHNAILWPSGHLMRDGVERIGGTRAVADILAAVPNVTVVLVRTRGLWGSMFSWAQTAKKPPLMNLLLQGAGLLLANLIFFTPRRTVTFTLEAFPPERRPEPTREQINPWLEAWYNADEKPETPTWVPYHFLLGREDYEFPPPPSQSRLDLSRVKAATKTAIAEIISERLRRPLTPEENLAETTFIQLGLDSLDAMEVTLEVEQRFGFTADLMPTTIGQLWALAEGMIEKGPPKPPPEKWFLPPSGDHECVIDGETVAEAFLMRVKRNPRDIAVADDISGVLTYETVFLAASILSSRFQDIPGSAVGLLMPASVGGIIALLAIHLSGKLPVILNWTTGPANMAHGVRLTGVKHVITSKRFIDRAHIEVPGTDFIFLEDVKATVSKFEGLRRLFLIKFFRSSVIRQTLSRLDLNAERPCVVLFTSGSEKAPKAVPLTHRNVISDLRGALPILKLHRDHAGLVFLPLFHSFGHTVTGLLPLFAGVKVVYHPDPTDAGGLVRKAAAYRPTLTATTPTFLGYIFDKAKPGDLDAIQMLVVGAEKCPERIFQRASELAPNAVIMEGYGVTECGPVVAVNPPDASKPGTIGLPLHGVEVAVTDLETEQLLPAGKMGMLHVAGPNVFPGYLGHDGEQPFREFAGKRWYITGDLAEIGDDGYLRFHGRLKRFLKAGGEMISLPALEEPFTRLFPPTEDGPQVAVEGIETTEGRHIVLFTTRDISLREANAVLIKEGFRGVMRLDEVRKIDAVPILGTGKTDYKKLRAMLASPESQSVTAQPTAY
jgi:long-chain-fatty-acid--[acyl-carrier-protein] ligase